MVPTSTSNPIPYIFYLLARSSHPVQWWQKDSWGTKGTKGRDKRKPSLFRVPENFCYHGDLFLLLGGTNEGVVDGAPIVLTNWRPLESQNGTAEPDKWVSSLFKPLWLCFLSLSTKSLPFWCTTSSSPPGSVQTLQLIIMRRSHSSAWDGHPCDVMKAVSLVFSTFTGVILPAPKLLSPEEPFGVLPMFQQHMPRHVHPNCSLCLGSSWASCFLKGIMKLLIGKRYGFCKVNPWAGRLLDTIAKCQNMALFGDVLKNLPFGFRVCWWKDIQCLCQMGGQGCCRDRKKESWTVMFLKDAFQIKRVCWSEGHRTLLFHKAEVSGCRGQGWDLQTAHSVLLPLGLYAIARPWGPSGLLCPSFQLGPAHHHLLTSESITNVNSRGTHSWCKFSFPKILWVLTQRNE